MNDVSTAVHALAGDVRNFRSDYDQKLEAMRSQLDTLTRKASRLAVGGSLETGDRLTGEQKAAFERFLRSGDPREIKAVNIGTQADGGFALPKEIHSEILRVEKNLAVMRQLARVETARTADFHV
ncbi:MAG: phage major capsid protein, partial [bacterium]